MKKFAAQSISLIILIGAVLIFFNPTNHLSQIDIPFLPQKPIISKLEINGVSFNVEIANTESKRNKGLSGRDSIASDGGMLFVFPKVERYVFWMKGMKIPLDFIWIKDDQFVDILGNIQPPEVGAKDESLPIYSSKMEFNKVLEVNAGAISRFNIKVGDTLKLQ